MAFLERNANRGSIPTGPFQIDNSCKFEAENDEYLTKDPSSAGNRKIFTTSMWVKRTQIALASSIFSSYPASSPGDTTVVQFGFMSTDRFQCGFQSFYVVNTTRVFRDMTAWYHIVVRVDTTQGTAANRFKLYINGVEETDFAVDGRGSISQNQDTGVNNTEPHRIGTLLSNGWDFSGYIAEVHHVDGASLAPTEFGEFDEDSGIWKPIKASPTYGTNGFYLDFKDASNLGNDANGGADFAETNIAAADQATDTPTNNFATMNALAGLGMGGTPFLWRNGNTEIKRDPDDSGGWVCVASTMAVNKGKWYAEFEVLESPSVTMYGYTTVAYLAEGGSGLNHPHFYLGTTIDSAGYYSNGDGANDAIYHNASNFPSAGVQSAAGTVISVAMDCDNNKIHFANNGTYTNSSNPANNTNGFTMVDDYVYFAHASNAGNKTYKVNLGGYTTDTPSSAASDANGYGTFEYAPPTGYYALCTKNLAEYG